LFRNFASDVLHFVHFLILPRPVLRVPCNRRWFSPDRKRGLWS
jgi:hypothetical protein